MCVITVSWALTFNNAVVSCDLIVINPWRACAARVTVLVCVSVCNSTSHFSRNYTGHKSFIAEERSKILSDFPWK